MENKEAECSGAKIISQCLEGKKQGDCAQLATGGGALGPCLECWFSDS